ncbi:GNAT family N-acetyltransferase [Herbiconiux sp. CPCC 205763]|uniref:GNAT family N-acetyltransferase n=1 Tax=Herbiconiux aconitum TaxID=2970913 RepID=A0ABT2GQ69_9MICO|nr:GNAT family N-acetyltransferase [Herbiconiux aconitum]MCS5718372.1 GNAT family N-acetyltransferase [Herbiconiux aconitum]
MGSITDYDFRTFSAALEGEGGDATRAWLQAETQGFHEPRLGEKSLVRAAAAMVSDGQMLTGAYARTRPEASLGAEVPVATFATFERSINVGGVAPLPAHLISAVTVRPTHRRNGILREMMTTDLDRAVADRYAIAALTVSEATIYRRFGFGVATTVHSISVATDQRFRLLTSPRGRCELIDAREIATLGPAIFAGFHASRVGSVDRHTKYWGRVSGLDGEKSEEDPSVRGALHYDDAGVIDGYVTYKFSGWESDPQIVEVVDLVAQNADAYLGLWQFLASLDLVGTVTYAAAPADDPLRWALADWRLVSVKNVNDWLWMRILDVVAAFEARGYVNDGSTVFAVSDPLGHAAGGYRMRVEGGRAEVTRDDAAAPDLELDASALGSVYLGGADPRVLAAAGQISERSPGAAAAFARLLAPAQQPYGITHF